MTASPQRIAKASAIGPEPWKPAVLAITVAVLAVTSIQLTLETGRIAAIWPGNALILFALLRSPTGRWPVWSAAGYAGCLSANLIVGDHAGTAASMAAFNLIEVLIAAALCRRFAGAALDLRQPGQLLTFVAAAGLAGPATSALLSATTLGILQGADFALTFENWYAADALGLVILTPVLLTLRRTRPASLLRDLSKSSARLPLAALGVTLALVFGWAGEALLFLVLPALVFCAFRLSSGGTALAILVTLGVTLASTLMANAGSGDELGRKLIVAQLFLATAALATLALSAVLSERRKALSDLAESEARYRLLASNALDIIATFGPDTRFTYLSPSIERVLGYRPEELIGRSTRDIMDPDDYQASLTAYRAQLAEAPTGQPFAFSYRARHKDGSTRWLEGRPTPVRDPESGDLLGFQDVVRDVTARREMEAALARSEAQYRELAEVIPDLILRLDGTRITYASPSARLLGYAPDEIIGREISEFIHPDDAAASIHRAHAAAKGDVRSDIRREQRVRKADGSWVWLEGRPRPVRDADGHVVEVVNTFRDITARKAMEAELAAAREAAEAAARVKADFMANMSHEIRTPLTAILGFTALLAARDDLAPEAEGQLSRVSHAGKALLAIVNDVLDFSKLEAGQMNLRPRAASLHEVLSESLALFEPQAAAKGVTLVFEPGSDLPLAEVDPDRLRQILLNLVGNAVKFTEHGAVRVRADYDAGTSRLRVEVTDTGAGMDAEQQARLFQRFSQVDASSTRRHGGTGLGLAICRGLVEAMGGDIGVTSRPGEGSTFWFHIEAPGAVAQPEDEGSAGGIDLDGVRVLVADDNAMNRELVGALLRPFGAEVTEAADGLEAVEFGRTQPFDIILMDVRMPHLDGSDATLRLRTQPGPNQTIPILAFTADFDVERLGEHAGRGFDGRIRKPVDPSELLLAIAQHSAFPMPSTTIAEAAA
jgi:PAS domain S-box-containing protein